MRVDLLNGDDRPGPIGIELLLSDTSDKPSSSLLLGEYCNTLKPASRNTTQPSTRP